jgi:hypothetical protein
MWPLSRHHQRIGALGLSSLLTPPHPSVGCFCGAPAGRRAPIRTRMLSTVQRTCCRQHGEETALSTWLHILQVKGVGTCRTSSFSSPYMPAHPPWAAGFLIVRKVGMRTASDFWEFLQAIWADWAARMSGIISIAVWAASAIISKELPIWLFWPAGLIAFLIATFRVWQREHHIVVELQSFRFLPERVRQTEARFSALTNMEKTILEQLCLNGGMMESQISAYLQAQGFEWHSNLVSALDGKTTFLERTFEGR